MLQAVVATWFRSLAPDPKITESGGRWRESLMYISFTRHENLIFPHVIWLHRLLTRFLAWASLFTESFFWAVYHTNFIYDTKVWFLIDYLQANGQLHKYFATSHKTRLRKTPVTSAVWFGCWSVGQAPVVEMPTTCTTWKAVGKQRSALEDHRVSEC